jgi:hypothetical protein
MSSSVSFGQTYQNYHDVEEPFSYRTQTFEHVVYSGETNRLQAALQAQSAPESVTLDFVASHGFNLSFDQLEKYPALKDELASRLQLLGYDVTENIGGMPVYDYQNGQLTPKPARVTTASVWQAYERFMLAENYTFPEEAAGATKALKQAGSEIYIPESTDVIDLPARKIPARIMAVGNANYRGSTELSSSAARLLLDLTVGQPTEALISGLPQQKPQG